MKEATKNSDALVYRAKEDEMMVSAIMKNDSIWLSRKNMAALFDCSIDNIALHLKNIFKTGELEEKSVTEVISATAADGKKYLTHFYNLDAIISVGYRVNSKKATEFRIWATGVLKEHLMQSAMRRERSLAYAKLLERAEKLSITEQELKKKILALVHEVEAARAKVGEIGGEIREPFQGGVDYMALVRKATDQEWWDELGTAMSEFLEHVDKIAAEGSELYEYVDSLIDETQLKPLISDVITGTRKIINFGKKAGQQRLTREIKTSTRGAIDGVTKRKMPRK